MADEKIFKDEIMDDAELDAVAGGTLKETFDDREKLSKLGIYDFNVADGFSKTVQNGFAKFGNEYGLKIDVNVNLKANEANKYSINGKEIGRDELWSIINEINNANKK